MSAKQLDFASLNKSITIEMTEEEHDKLASSLPEGVSISEGLRQIVDVYSRKERNPRHVTFWIPNEQYAQLQAKSGKASMYFKTYMRQLITDFFRDGGKV